MSDYDLVQATSGRVGVFPDHICRRVVPGEGISLLDEIRKIPQLAKLHHQVYMGGGLLTVDQSDNVWVMQAFEYVDLGVQVLFELLIKLVQVDRLDSHIAWLLL